MSPIQILVLLAALAAIAWVNWHFFASGRRAAAAPAPARDGAQEIDIVVRGGYEPAVVEVRAGVPVRLVFERRDDSGCSEEVVVPDFGLRRFLPAGERTAVEFTPTRPGTHDFTCGMGMLHGRVIVRAGKE